jgi:hypothetical protein
MDATISRSVGHMSNDDRIALEGILGVQLVGNQQLVITAYTPDLVPDEQIRSGARLRLEAQLRKSELVGAQTQVTAEDADREIADAMHQIRPRP